MAAKLLLAIAAGGAIGALGRHWVAGWVMAQTGMGFPWGTLTVNVVGSFTMGILVEVWALHWSPDPALRAFMAVGVLGAFTTFSTFSLEVALLIERNQWTPALGYVLGSTLLSVLALFAGLRLVRLVS